MRINQNILFLIALILSQVCTRPLDIDGIDINDPDQVKIAFLNFIEKFKKQYDIGSVEGKHRFTNFIANLVKIKEHNSQGFSYKLGVTKFADLTGEEFANKYLIDLQLNQQAKPQLSSFIEIESNKNLKGGKQYEYTDKIDWFNTLGYPRDQQDCKSSWAFATVTAVEAAQTIEYSYSPVLSVKQLLDCDTTYNRGCDGGLPNLALHYIDSFGLETEYDYGYSTEKETCSYLQNQPYVFTKGYKYCANNNALGDDANKCSFTNYISLLKKGPLISLFDASADFHLYAGGIYDASCKRANHVVLTYGFEDITKRGPAHFTVRNSWGEDWGEGGDFRVRYEKDNKDSCFLMSYGYLPLTR
jgi:KDEL-tailed cysteine endopeptidase